MEQRRSILQEYMNKVVLLAEVLTLCAADLKELLQPGPGDAEIKYLWVPGASSDEVLCFIVLFIVYKKYIIFYLNKPLYNIL